MASIVAVENQELKSYGLVETSSFFCQQENILRKNMLIIFGAKKTPLTVGLPLQSDKYLSLDI